MLLESLLNFKDKFPVVEELLSSEQKPASPVQTMETESIGETASTGTDSQEINEENAHMPNVDYEVSKKAAYPEIGPSILQDAVWFQYPAGCSLVPVSCRMQFGSSTLQDAVRFQYPAGCRLVKIPCGVPFPQRVWRRNAQYALSADERNLTWKN